MSTASVQRAGGHEHDEGLALQPSDEESVAAPPAGCLGGCARAALRRDGPGRRHHAEPLRRPRPRGVSPTCSTARSSACEAAAATVPAPSRSACRATPCSRSCCAWSRASACASRLTNGLDDPASLHIHSSTLVIAGTGEAATADNPGSLPPPAGGRRTSGSWPTTSRRARTSSTPTADARYQSGHGLFGTFVVEPPGPSGSTRGPARRARAVGRRDPHPRRRRSASSCPRTTRSATRTTASPPPTAAPLPQVDPLTTPTGRVPGRSTTAASRSTTACSSAGADGIADESLAYSSYAFGDPATPIMRSLRRRAGEGAGGARRRRGLPRPPRARRLGALAPPAAGRTDRLRRRARQAPAAAARRRPSGPTRRASDRRSRSTSTTSARPAAASRARATTSCTATSPSTTSPGMWGDLARVQHAAGRRGVHRRAPAAAVAGGARRRDRARGAARDSSRPTSAERRAGTSAPRRAPGRTTRRCGTGPRSTGRIFGEPETTASWPGYAVRDAGRRPPVLFDRDTGSPAIRCCVRISDAALRSRPNHGPAPYFDVAVGGRRAATPGGRRSGALCPAGTTAARARRARHRVPIPLERATRTSSIRRGRCSCSARTRRRCGPTVGA